MTTRIIIARHGNTFTKEQTPTRVGCRTDLPLVEEERGTNVGLYLTKYNLGKGYDKFYEKLKKAYFDIDSLGFFEKRALVNSIANLNARLEMTNNDEFINSDTNDINKYGNIYEDEFETIYHEVGHCFDFKSDMAFVKFLDLFRGKSELKILQIPDYPKTNRLEFVASIFSGIMQGEKYPSEVMDIYNKLIKFKMPS